MPAGRLRIPDRCRCTSSSELAHPTSPNTAPSVSRGESGGQFRGMKGARARADWWRRIGGQVGASPGDGWKGGGCVISLEVWTEVGRAGGERSRTPRSGADAPLPGLDLRELALPGSVVQHDCPSTPSQVPSHCRARICLLKGCEKWFSPSHPLSRYCSEACAEAARRWSRRRAARRYRASERGKQRRRQQSCRYRERVRRRQEEALSRPAAGEGHQEAANSGKICCSRPGCYELFLPERRSPLKKFCCALCREALRRVRQREARWRRRFSSVGDGQCWDRHRGPPEWLA